MVGRYPYICLLCSALYFHRNRAFWGAYILQNSDNKPWAYICSKGFFAGLISRELIIGGNFTFQNGSGWTIKIRKQPKTANDKSPWTYIREGLLSEGYLPLLLGLYFGRVFFRCGAGGGGAYYRNCTLKGLRILGSISVVSTISFFSNNGLERERVAKESK